MKPSSTTITSSTAAYVVCERLIESKNSLRCRPALLDHRPLNLKPLKVNEPQRFVAVQPYYV